MDVEGGESLLSIAARIAGELPFSPICARVNNKSEDLSFPVFAPKQVEFLDSKSATGRRVYVRSMCMMLYKAVRREAGMMKLRIEHSISKGYFCRLIDGNGKVAEVSEELCVRLQKAMEDIRDADLPFERRERLTSDVARIFERQNLDDKVRLLRSNGDLYTTFYKLGDTADSYYGPLAPRTSYIKVFSLSVYKDGFLMMGPGSDNSEVPQTPVVQEKMYKAFTDYLRFNRVIKVSDVGELNMAVRRRETRELINVAEAMHDKLLGRISDEISRRNAEGGARVVMIAGPSSSGKTTSAKRLAIQLMTNLMTPKMISLDDYFVDREMTPREATGDSDYESIHALDLERLNSDLRRLLAGETINLPTYSFELGRRVDRVRPLSLAKNEVLLMEGIHGLNPELASSIPEGDIFKMYVSALTTLSIDDHNWISTTDNRLLRRIVRDYKYRHTSAQESIRRWPSVRRGEEKWIFPFQENADAMFNSSLIFELGVMKAYAEPLLREVPHNSEEYAEAYRLMRLLSYFDCIPVDQIPTTSLLREFLGGSSFHY